jgi:hypothetical protein
MYSFRFQTYSCWCHVFNTLTYALGVFLSRLLQIPTPQKPSVAAGISLQVNGIFPSLLDYKEHSFLYFSSRWVISNLPQTTEEPSLKNLCS